MAAQVTARDAMPGPTHTEAPASASCKVTSPRGFEWILTLRSDTANDMMTRTEALEGWLVKHDWQPAATRPTSPGNSQASAPTEAAPLCNICHQPMKRRQTKDGTRSFWSCGTKYANGQWCQGKPQE